MRTFRNWSKLAGETVQLLSREGFKAGLDKVLRCLVCSHRGPWFKQEVELETSKATSSMNSPVILPEEVLTVCFLMTSPTHPEPHSHLFTHTSVLTPGTNSSAAAGTEYTKKSELFLWFSGVTILTVFTTVWKENKARRKAKGFSKKQDCKTMLNGSVHRQVKFLSEISWFSLIENSKEKRTS